MQIKVPMKSESAGALANCLDVYLTVSNPKQINVTKEFKHLIKNKRVTAIAISSDNMGSDAVRLIGSKVDLFAVAEEIMIAMDYGHEFMELVQRSIRPMEFANTPVNSKLLTYQEEY